VAGKLREAQTPSPASAGVEPPLLEEELTPKNLEKGLKEFLTICARRTGMERILAIRRKIHKIEYSKKTISVEFFTAARPTENPHQRLFEPLPRSAQPRLCARPP
jgi:hypothetical protein